MLCGTQPATEEHKCHQQKQPTALLSLRNKSDDILVYGHRGQRGRRGAEHSWIFRCLLKSTNEVKLNKLKLETAAELHTAHPCFYCRRYKLNLKSDSEDTTAKNAAGVRGY